MWKNLKIRREAVPGNIRLFNLYAQKEITFRQLKEAFMKRNDIEYLTDEDFKHWHDEVTMAVEVKKNEQYAAMIQERAKGLKHYEKGEVVMNPIGSFQQCIEVGHTLHNCIRTYAERYAKGECDLYYISDKGQIVVAIEVRRGEVKQARSDHNGAMPAKYNKVLEYCFG